MEKYKLVKKLGEGAYGIVVKCINQQTQEIVAIKKMKGQFANWEECLNMPEVQALKRLNNSPYLIKIKEMVHNKKENEVNIVFEFCDKNLFQEMQDRSRRNSLFSEAQIKNIMYQALAAVQYMHQNGYMHRDIKPENFLINQTTANGPLASEQMHIKLADFGLAKNFKVKTGKLSEYVSTRWYRAPELVLRSSTYSQSVDVFALACIMAELYMGRPIFPGSTEADQLTRIVTVLGTPTQQEWPEGLQLAQQKGIKFPSVGQQNLRQHFLQRSDISDEAFDLMSKMLKYSADQRITAQQAMQHEYFRDISQNLKSMAAGGSMNQINQRRFQRAKNEDTQAYEEKGVTSNNDNQTNPYGLQQVVPLTQQYVSNKVPEISHTNSPGLSQKAKFQPQSNGGVGLNHRLDMNPKVAPTGGSGMTYGIESSSVMQPVKRAERFLGIDNCKPLYSSSLRNSGQVAMEVQQYKSDAQSNSLAEKQSQSVFNPRLSRYGVFNNITIPKGPVVAQAQINSGAAQLQQQPSYNLMERNMNYNNNNDLFDQPIVRNSNQNIGGQGDILDRMINTDKQQAYQNNQTGVGGGESRPSNSFYTKPNIMMLGKNKNKNSHAYAQNDSGIPQSQSVGILQIPRSSSRLDDNNQSTIPNPYQNKENIQKGNYGSSARGLSGVGQNIMGPILDIKSDSEIPIIKPQNIIPAKEGQQPKPNQFSNLGQSLIMSSNKAMRQQFRNQQGGIETNSGNRNQISNGEDYLDQQQYMSQRNR